MTSEWRECTLGDFVRLQRGHDLTAAEQQVGSVPVMGSAGHNGFHNKSLASGPGVIVGRSGASAGRVHFSEVDYWPHNTCLYATDFLGNDPKFVYYLLKTLDLASFNSGSAQPSLNRNYLYSISVKVPSLELQKQIVAILNSLDDRITLLRKTNQTLEAIAQALFKSWFVDFDLVRSKAEGKLLEGIDAETASLFPVAFAETELGPIPKNWSVCNLSDAINFKDGKTWPPKERVDYSEVTVFGANGKVGFAKSQLGIGRVIFLGKIGSCGALNFYNGKWWASNNCFYIQKEDNAGLEWCRGIILGIDFQGYIGGSSNPYMPLKNFSHHQIVKPPTDVIAAYENLCSPIREKIEFNEALINNYSELRDTLLPRLISGQLRIADAEEELAKATA